MTTKQDLITEALDLAEISPPKPKFHVWVEGYGRAQLHHHLDIRPFLAALARVSGEPLHRIVLAATIQEHDGCGFWRDITPPEVAAWGWSELDESFASGV